LELKNIRRGRIREYAEKYKSAVYYKGKNVWDVIREQSLKVDLVFPSAHENEIDGNQAWGLVQNGCYCVSEGANMPTTPDGVAPSAIRIPISCVFRVTVYAIVP